MNTNVKHHLILIDDNDIDQLLHSKIIEITVPETSIQSFGDATIALNHIKNLGATSNHHTIIFLDIQMPVMNGFQFLEAYHLLPTEVKQLYTIYILSSSVNQHDISKAKNNPYIKDMLIKPLSKDTLTNILR
ncbi:hypothetical protein AEM51_04170 [Bacteroidetes bacterium UKL13-3]|nr:hypothetical protein AEM51_04170 [Bacteroidetes bacterium UKL13-3]